MSLFYFISLIFLSLIYVYVGILIFKDIKYFVGIVNPKEKPMKTKLLRKLRKRFVWKWNTGIYKWEVFDLKHLDMVYGYDFYGIVNSNPNDLALLRMMSRIRLGAFFKSNYARQKRRWSDAKKQRIINEFLNGK